MSGADEAIRRAKESGPWRPASLVPKSELTSFIRALGFDPKQTVDLKLMPGGWEVLMYVCDREGQFVVFDGLPVTVTLAGKWSDE